MSDDLLVAYRHDVHKMRARPHSGASTTFAGVKINQAVPMGADIDAALLSRPHGQPKQTVDNHVNYYRISLLTGESVRELRARSFTDIEPEIVHLLQMDDPKAMHRAWLESDIVAVFNESPYYPYTSLKYHTLLVAALLANYQGGVRFNDLNLVVDPVDVIVPHQTIFSGNRCNLRLSPETGSQPFAQLESQPCQSWASTWNRLTENPLDVDNDEYARMLDANLRRIRAWSTGLQYIEDFELWRMNP